ncbi:OsmC family protein [Paenibacillus radicis (ex Xue et al. 2023)]|uniref:OsmC family protein n=1 Tax=Paenibacillus radicis (ex Xue et al. 2023) TaxID=2972489 RepID=A0ABT1YJK1_9BACL|nr:OsmC family protein [Paenibacillus radicis (ex Xue et al. 2023)]MCR8633147.1 OsmC family protein [Paenibacillus radicis (ex Xue et al. 2023)]
MTGSKMQMQVTAEWLGKRRFQAKGPSGYPVVMDSSEQFGGEDSGNSPLELILVGLVGCIGIGVTKLLEKMRQSLESLDIVADGIREESLPHAIIEIHLTFNVKGAVAPSRIWQAVKLESEQYCPVAASLKAVIVPHVVLNGIDTPAPSPEGLEEQQ